MGWRRVYNRFVSSSEKKQEKITRLVGTVGELDQDILENWMFWRLIKKDFSLFAYQDKLSFPDVQKLNAILDMDEDQEKAYNQYFAEETKKLNSRK